MSYPKDPDLEWCPPGHGDLYTALRGTGLLNRLIDAGYERVFVSNSDNLGAVPDPRVAGWFARSGAPFAIEAVRRTPSDRKGGHFARRKIDSRIVLREIGADARQGQARRSPIWSATGSARPTTSGSTSGRCSASSTAAAASSACR